MKIVCPHCNFARDVADSQVPDRPVKVTCPRCQQGFSFDKATVLAAAAFDADFATGPAAPATDAPATDAPATDAPATVTCPACGLEQPDGAVCSGCGVDYARWAARQQARQNGGATPSPGAGSPIPGRADYAAADPAARPKAGFWIRVAACLVDSLILGAVQFVIGLLLGLAGGTLAGMGEESLALGALTWLCSSMISLTYYIFFTGYNGQTPGKMALRLQVVRCDGQPMGYGVAFLREVLGKFLSAIILGIGYLMVAFDRNKQGLHDRIAGTYVIRL